MLFKLYIHGDGRRADVENLAAEGGEGLRPQRGADDESATNPLFCPPPALLLLFYTIWMESGELKGEFTFEKLLVFPKKK